LYRNAAVRPQPRCPLDMQPSCVLRTPASGRSGQRRASERSADVHLPVDALGVIAPVLRRSAGYSRCPFIAAVARMLAPAAHRYRSPPPSLDSRKCLSLIGRSIGAKPGLVLTRLAQPRSLPQGADAVSEFRYRNLTFDRIEVGAHYFATRAYASPSAHRLHVDGCRALRCAAQIDRMPVPLLHSAWTRVCYSNPSFRRADTSSGQKAVHLSPRSHCLPPPSC
jgi:hypothetical protein